MGGISRGLSQGMGLQAIGRDLGIDLKLTLKTDATAAIGISRRLGVGKIRHLDTSLLWVQEHVRSGNVILEKIPGPINPGDALTKYLSGPELRGHLARMNLVFEEGRASSAPQLTTVLRAELRESSQAISRAMATSDILDAGLPCALEALACPAGHVESTPPWPVPNISLQGVEEKYLPAVAGAEQAAAASLLAISYQTCQGCGSTQPAQCTQCGLCESALQSAAGAQAL